MAPDMFWRCGSCGHSETLVVTCPQCGQSTHPEKLLQPEPTIRDLFIEEKKIIVKVNEIIDFCNKNKKEGDKNIEYLT